MFLKNSRARFALLFLVESSPEQRERFEGHGIRIINMGTAQEIRGKFMPIYAEKCVRDGRRCKNDPAGL